MRRSNRKAGTAPAAKKRSCLAAPFGDYPFSRDARYWRTIRATRKTMAWSNSRKSRPVSFRIFSRRYTRVLRWTNSFREVSETFRLFSKNLLMVNNVSWSRESREFFLKTSRRKISHRVVGSW